MVGASSSGDGFFSGKLSNIHVSKKIAKYTTNFTPPTRNATPILGSSLIVGNDSTDATTEKSGKEVIWRGGVYSGNFGSSYVYDNGGHYTGYQSNPLDSNNLQWEAWVKFTEYAKINNYFMQIFVTSGASPQNGSGNLSIYVADGSISGQDAGSVVFQKGTILGHTSPINDGKWHHIAITRGDGGSNYWKIYQDGALVDESIVSGSLGNSNHRLQWGVGYYTNARFTN